MHHNRLARLAALLCGLLLAAAAGAQGYGPRALQLVPENSNVVTVYGVALNGNQSIEPGSVVKGSDIDVTLGIAQYTRAFRLPGGQQGAVVVALPYGRIDARMDTNLPDRPRLEAHRSGLFDPQVALVVGLVGSPSLPMPDYARFRQGFALGVMTNLYVPLGSYESARAINTGSNRWAVQFGAPMSFNFGKSLITPDHGTFELLPAVTFYGNNNDPFGAAERTGQRPLFTLESHLTKNVNRMAWVSLDGMYSNGGASITDGLRADNRQESFAIGGSLNLTFSPAFSAKLSYGGVLARNENGPEGGMWRLMGSYVF
ncbi:transporter [Sandaracinobacteroides hominis]|uniref:transporter n=1 Tax=Sandaracinobacteroides hominis TaxID=2780086 RepID=UPI0018F77959|nr:transporter [Sandaracinobacteroides hominis]